MLQIKFAPDRGGALNKRTLSSSLSSTVPTEWAIPAQRALAHSALQRERLPVLTQTLQQTLRLPDSLSSFLLFTVGVAIICVGLTLHLQLSTTILQDRIRLAELQVEEQALQEETSNLVWAIAQETELNNLKVRATALGYEPALTRNYIIAPNDPQVAIMQTDE